MQTKSRRLSDRNTLLHPAPDAGRPAPRLPSPDSGVSGILEALAHTALVLILLGALFLSGHHRPVSAVPAGPTARVPAVRLSPAVAETSPASGSAVNHCL